jgi:hypothetical protein
MWQNKQTMITLEGGESTVRAMGDFLVFQDLVVHGGIVKECSNDSSSL